MITVMGRIARGYFGGGIKERAFLFLRWWLTPYGDLADRVPQTGRILDLGSGHGLLSLLLAMSGPQRIVEGVDLDPERVLKASRAAEGISNLRFRQGDLRAPTRGEWDAVLLIDVLHYFSREDQEKIVRAAFESLSPGGVCLAREVSSERGVLSRLNQAYEGVATRIGFTRTADKGLTFRTETEWRALFEREGFQVHVERVSAALFADVLYTCRKA